MNHEHERPDGMSMGGVFAAGLFAGVAIGAGLGLLYAPRKGSELREQLADATTKAGKRVSKTVDALTERGRHLYERARDVVPHVGIEFSRAADAAVRATDGDRNAAREKTA